MASWGTPFDLRITKPSASGYFLYRMSHTSWPDFKTSKNKFFQFNVDWFERAYEGSTGWFHEGMFFPRPTRSLKVSRKLFGTNLWRQMECYLNTTLNRLRLKFKTRMAANGTNGLFWTFFEMDKSCVPVAKLALSQKKYWHCGQSTYCIWFCSENFLCWVLPGEGLFHQLFLKAIFDFGNMWQLRIWNLDLNMLRATQKTLFQHAFRSMDVHGEKFSDWQKSCLQWVECCWDTVDKVPTAFGFAVIISSVGSYQERVYFINYSWRLSLTSVTCGSFGYEI